ncbi:MAG TPA: hypothetical protein VHK06_03365 [Candidatus Limnocylindria bacterium]|nr:hypothetical protein [Candidatus Limnocylindria bacterium]
MPDASPILSAALLLAMLGVLLWFTVGTQRNIRRGNDLLRWLQDGLPALGRRTTLRWLGSSVAQLGLVDAREPFRELELLVVMEPRDLGALWALARARGRRDFLIVRGSVRRAPRRHALAVDPAGWTAGHAAVPGEPSLARHETWSDGEGRPIDLSYDDPDDGEFVRERWNRLAALGVAPWRVAVRPIVPHLELHLAGPQIERVGSARLLETVRRIAEEL